MVDEQTGVAEDNNEDSIRTFTDAEGVAMQLTGHKTRAIFERYNITSPGDLREAARRLDAYTSAV